MNIVFQNKYLLQIYLYSHMELKNQKMNFLCCPYSLAAEEWI